MPPHVAFAIAAHPDDIEFRCAGTLMLLKETGWETHYMNLSSGSLGSATMSASRTRATRKRESRNAAALLGAYWHPSLCDDLEITYNLTLLRRLAAVIRDVKPALILTHPPIDYMEDHTNACRLTVTAAFSRGMRNFRTIPRRSHYNGDVTLYHFMPHGLRDPLNRAVFPEFFIDTTSVHEKKLKALAAHQSQGSWLAKSQAMDSYLTTLDKESANLGRLSSKFNHAEGFWRHLPLGFCAEEANPLKSALGNRYLENKKSSSRCKLNL